MMDGDFDLLEDPSAKLTALCDTFLQHSNANLAEAVKLVNASLPGDPRVFFVNPQTEAKNAAFAPESFVWEPDEIGDPTDPVWLPIRKQQRDDHKDRLKSEPSSLTFFLANDSYKVTKGNSSFHPNPAGAFRYFEKMRPVLDLATQAKRVAIRAKSGHYLCAEGGGGSALNANRTALGPWETFEMVDLGGNAVALRSVNGRYVCAEGGGGQASVVDRMRLGSWERFVRVPQSSEPNTVALQAANGRYLSAANGGGTGTAFTASAIGPSEVFHVI